MCDSWSKEGIDPKVAHRKASSRAIAAASIGGQEALLEVLANLDDREFADAINEVMQNASRLSMGQPMVWARAPRRHELRISLSQSIAGCRYS